MYVDTGAMYRTMALHFIRSGIDPKDEQAVAASCRDVDVSLRYENGVQQVLLGGENVTGLIRTCLLYTSWMFLSPRYFAGAF